MLTRPQLAARIHTLRAALNVLGDQADRDGHGRFFAEGPMKVELGRMEADLRQIDAPTSLGARLEAQLHQCGGAA